MKITTLIILTLTLCILNSGCDSESSRDAVFYNNRGLTYFNQGELDKAFADFTKAIELDPQMIMAYQNRGSLYFTQGELDAAIADHTKAIELDPANAVTHYYRGIVFEKLGDKENAEADYAKAKELGYEPE